MTERREAEAWYVACTTRELRAGPLASEILGTQIVLFRDARGRAAALLDRCAHRNAPLAPGRIRGDRIECPYHGWQFDADGACGAIPGLVGTPEGKARRVPSFPAVERDGYVWVFAASGAAPGAEPYALPPLDPGGVRVQKSVDVDSGLHAFLENTLDVPHTLFVHRGLLRSERKPVDIQAVMTRTANGVEVEYIGEPLPSGLVVRILSPSGGVVRHVDRFILPSIAQVDYRLGEENHVRVTSICTPRDAERLRVHATLDFRLRIPARLVIPFVAPITWRIFQQDAEILSRQTETLRRFGGPAYVSTEIDAIGDEIRRLLRYGARAGEEPGAGPTRREFTLRI